MIKRFHKNSNPPSSKPSKFDLLIIESSNSSIFQGSNPSNSFYNTFRLAYNSLQFLVYNTYVHLGNLTLLLRHVSSRTNERIIYTTRYLGGRGRDFTSTWCTKETNRETKRDRKHERIRFSGNIVKKKMVRCQPLILN